MLLSLIGDKNTSLVPYNLPHYIKKIVNKIALRYKIRKMHNILASRMCAHGAYKNSPPRALIVQ
jgi:hypothetical protein